MKNYKKNQRKIGLFFITFIIFIFIFYNFNLRNDSSLALSRYGSSGNEVRQIQTKLKRWGYYNGNIDGIYGSKTVAAVKWFQSKNGLKADGIAGPATLKALGITSSGSNSRDGKQQRLKFAGAFNLC